MRASVISLRHCVAAVLLTAMLVHASLVPVHLSMRLANAMTSALDTLIASEICTADGKAHPADDDAAGKADCSFCIGMASLHLMTPPAGIEAEHIDLKASAPANFETERVIRFMLLSALGRGPPPPV